MTALASDKPLNDARHAVVITLPDLGSMCGRRLIDVAEDEIGPRHPRVAEPPPALFLELNPAARARTN